MNRRDIIPPAAMLTAMVIAVLLAFLHGAYRIQSPVSDGEPGIVDETTAVQEGTSENFCKKHGETLIEVNIPATELTLYEDGIPKFRRKVAVGQGVYPTPEQASSIKGVEWNPWWYPPDAPWAKGAKPMPPGPKNPMGLAKMALSQEVLFHGTFQEWSIGRPASHGCMRMHNRDVKELGWYLQQRFSRQCDPALWEKYKRENGRTFTVKFDTPVPVEVVYRPVVARDGKLVFFPDHYNRVAGKREAAILIELITEGYDISGLNEDAVKAVSKRWPLHESVLIESLMREKPVPDMLGAPECS